MGELSSQTTYKQRTHIEREKKENPSDSKTVETMKISKKLIAQLKWNTGKKIAEGDNRMFEIR